MKGSGWRVMGVVSSPSAVQAWMARFGDEWGGRLIALRKFYTTALAGHLGQECLNRAAFCFWDAARLLFLLKRI